MNRIIVSLILVCFVNQTFPKNLNNVQIVNDQVGELCFTTMTIRTTEEWLNNEDELIEFNSFPNIRYQGFIMDMFYSNAGFGLSQWTEMTTRGIYMMSPGTLYLPLSKWEKEGMKPGWRLRISILYPAVKEYCK